MREHVYIVTGGNASLGFECATTLSKLPTATVIIACRDKSKGDLAARSLNTAGGDVLVMPLDLASLASVRTFGAACERLKSPLAALICNAGVQEVEAPSKTKDGFESTFGVNHLGHFLLAQLLLPLMSQEGRILFVASGVHDPAEKTGLPDPVYTSARQLAADFEVGYKAGLRRYATSKLCNVYCAYEFSRRLAAMPDERLRSLHVNAFDPGLMPGTGLARQYSAPLRFLWHYLMPVLTLFKRNVHTAKTSGRRLADLASNQKITVNGKYFSDGVEKRSSDLSYDLQNAKDLWESSVAMVRLTSS